MAPTRSHTNVPGHIGIGCFTFFPSLETFGLLIPQEPVVVQSSIFFGSLDILYPP